MKKLILYLFLALSVVALHSPRETWADIAADDARDTYTGNGSTTVFTYNFKILTSANIAVYQAGTLKTLTTHYTLTGIGNDAGGTVVFVTAPANGEQVLLLRSQPISQVTSYIDGAISAATIERDFDRQTSVDQMQQEEINRTIKYPKTITPTTGLTELPTPVAEKCIGYNSGATALALKDCAGGGGGAAFTTSAGLAGILTDETGTDKAVFSDSPTFTTKLTVPRIDLSTCQVLQGSGSPEGVVTAPVCSTYRRTDGGAATTLYVKESGAGNTGWIAYGSPAGSGAPTTATYITQTPDGTLSNEQALSALATGMLKNTTGTGVLSIGVAGTDYLTPASSITNGQLPSTISSKTLDNSNTITVQDINLTIQDNGDTTKQARFNASGITTGTTRTLDLPNANTRLMGDADFAGTHYGSLVRTGSGTYVGCRDNITAVVAPASSDDSTQNYCIGSMWVNTTPSPRDVYVATNVTAAAATWRNLGTSTEADTLSTVMGRGNVATAESFATGLQIQNAGGTVKVSRFVDATFGPRDQCSPECDAVDFIPTNKNYVLYSQEGADNVLVVDPDATSRNAMYQFGTNYKPQVSFEVPLTERGAVTIALAGIVANQPKDYWATVTDADTDALDFNFRVNKRMEGITTATVTLEGVSDNAAPAGNIQLHCAMTSVRPGIDTYAAHSTTGEQAITLTPATQNRPVAATSPAITINGTIVEGARIWGSCEVSAAGTTSAQLTDFFLLAKATITLNVNSISD